MEVGVWLCFGFLSVFGSSFGIGFGSAPGLVWLSLARLGSIQGQAWNKSSLVHDHLKVLDCSTWPQLAALTFFQPNACKDDEESSCATVALRNGSLRRKLQITWRCGTGL